MDPATILGLSYVGKKGVDVVAEFVKDAFGPSVKAAGEGLAAPVEAWKQRRAEQAAKTVVEAAVLLDETGRQAQPVPGRILWPLLEKASVEEDDSLHAAWVRLLANAAAPAGEHEVLPAFVQILSELSPQEARILHQLYHLRRSTGPIQPKAAMLSGSHLKQLLIGEDVALIEDNMMRLRLFAPEPLQIDGQRLRNALMPMLSKPNDVRRTSVRDVELKGHNRPLRLTRLGAAFLNACMWQGDKDDSSSQ